MKPRTTSLTPEYQAVRAWSEEYFVRRNEAHYNPSPINTMLRKRAQMKLQWANQKWQEVRLQRTQNA